VRYVFFVCDRVSFCFIDGQCKEEKQKHHPPANTGFNNSTSTPSSDGRCIRCLCRAAFPLLRQKTGWRSITLQSGPKRSPFGAHPAADQRDRRDDGDQHDAEQNRIFDERSAFLVTLELFDQSRHLTHVSLQFVLMPNALLPRSSARTAMAISCVLFAASHKGLAAAPLAAGLAIVIVVVMFATTCSHEHRIVAVIVIEDRPCLGQASIVVRCGEHGDCSH